MFVKLIDAPERPFDGSVAAARSCYSPNIVTADDVMPPGMSDDDRAKNAAKRDSLAESIFNAGHHTTIQHANFKFALSGISRQAIWSFFHAHPWYNSEQVSQRYVEVNPKNVVNPLRIPVPFLPSGVTDIGSDDVQFFNDSVEAQMDAYHRLIELIEPVVRKAYDKRFPGRVNKKGTNSAVNKKALEVARYVLPIGTMAHMYHTISLLTLVRYWHARRLSDVPTETDGIVRKMVAEVLAHDSALVRYFPGATDDRPGTSLERTIPYNSIHTRDFARIFDEFMGGRSSRLVEYTHNLEPFFDAIHEVCGRQVPINDVLGSVDQHGGPEALNLDHHHPIRRAMAHVHYTFKHRISHTADSQDQRHRTTPASRPMLALMHSNDPDYVTPTLIKEAGGEILDTFALSMRRTWDAFRKLKEKFGFEVAQYILPNALTIRYTESGDLAAIRHKMSMRLCLNAQEEIFRSAVEEVGDISAVHPEIGALLIPPCARRSIADVSPRCPEGDRYCGVRAWTFMLGELVEQRGIL